MNVRRTRLILRLLTTACTIAVPAVIVVGLTVPRATTAEPGPSSARPRSTPTTGPAAAPPPDAFGSALDRPWRPSLGDTPSGTTAVASSAPALPAAALPQRLTLVGTVGESVALIRGPDGTVALVEVGDDVDGADVVAIREQQVDLRQGGRVVRLQKASPPADGALVR